MISISHKDFGDSQAAAANKLVDLFEGKQLKYVIQNLNGNTEGGYGFRWEWLERGFVPRMRNLVRPIVEKSAGALFAKAPKLNILPASSPSAEPVVDARLNELLTVADFQDFGQQWNYLSRLLRSVVILQQKVVGEDAATIDGVYRFDPTNGDLLVLTLLHRGNSVVRMNPTRTVITELAYLVKGCPTDDEWAYRYMNSEVDQTVFIKAGEEVNRINNVTDALGNPLGNVDGIVPAVMHYDTMKPRSGEWCHIPEDIGSLQDMVNTHLTDLEFALAKGKGQSLFTDADFKSGDDATVEPLARAGNRVGEHAPLSTRKKAGKNAAAAGIGAVIQLKKDRDATRSPYVEFKGPNVDLNAQQAVIEMLTNDVASDWSVNLKVAGQGNATSGFQLIVQELDNLTLREQRQVSFQATFRRLYSQLQLLYPELERGELIVEFQPVALPVNQKEVEEVWTMKIDGGRASVVDYLMVTEGLSREEAKARYAQLKEDGADDAEDAAEPSSDPNSSEDAE